MGEAAATTAASAKRGRAPLSDRSGVADLLVLAGAVALLLAGWAVKGWDEARLAPVALDGVALAYPTGWLPLPAEAPALARWTDPNGSGATLALYAEANARPAVFAALLGGPNPAAGRLGYTPLRSEPAMVGGVDAVRSDYAYVRAAPAGATVPVVVRGRQLAWADGERSVVLALEAPAEAWEATAWRFEAIAAAVVP